MRGRVNHVLLASALAALASGSISRAEEPASSAGEHQWVPSLAITSGVTMQDQKGGQESYLVDGESSPPGAISPLRPFLNGDDRAVSPFVGGALELMSPSLPVFPRLRWFASAEVLPTFATERTIAHEGEPSRVRGPQLGSVIAAEEDIFHWEERPTCGAQATYCPRIGLYSYGDRQANGQGMRTEAQVENLVFGARVGVAYTFEWRNRQMRLKPWLGWLEYKLAVKGYMVDATCSSVCTNIYDNSTTPPTVQTEGHLRESILSGHDSGVFDGIGPGIDLEMETGRLGPIGTALFVGIGAYYIPGDRDIRFTSTASFSDFFGNDTHIAVWNARVAPWIYRGGLGIRFEWLGSED